MLHPSRRSRHERSKRCRPVRPERIAGSPGAASRSPSSPSEALAPAGRHPQSIAKHWEHTLTSMTAAVDRAFSSVIGNSSGDGVLLPWGEGTGAGTGRQMVRGNWRAQPDVKAMLIDLDWCC